MNNQEVMNAFNEVSKLRYAADDAQHALEKAKDAYIDTLKQECVTNILTIQEERGKLTQHELDLILSSMLSSLKNVYR